MHDFTARIRCLVSLEGLAGFTEIAWRERSDYLKVSKSCLCSDYDMTGAIRHGSASQ